ncbi:hypothetical protein CS0771_00320 [Catellatospora sp. IY07-71]|uniref:hypothetical protein n=1 Tax=Catellatospora sp. IY07-71 TaxID=2728827 RepID=UPI001BB361B4|nr:hypothetical protein [Catellatospora sp. IY07-71]BCJ70488.1 hypothetical protein CS0771_00320 [Catellatospora sp. IY07-71]
MLKSPLRPLTGMLLAASLLSVTAACGATAEPAQPQAAATTSAALAEVDRHNPEDAKFFEALRPDGAVMVPPPASIPAALDQSTLVVIAKVGAVSRHKPTLDLPNAALELKVVEVVSGSLPEGKPLLVQMPLFATWDADADVAALSAKLPQGPVLWFLRWQGKPVPATKPGVEPLVGDPALHSLVHYHSVFAQGLQGVQAVFAEHDSPRVGITGRAEQFATMSELIRQVKAAK